jgi:hypothetical protein
MQNRLLRIGTSEGAEPLVMNLGLTDSNVKILPQVDGVKVEIQGPIDEGSYDVEFLNPESQDLLYRTCLSGAKINLSSYGYAQCARTIGWRNIDIKVKIYHNSTPVFEEVVRATEH